MTALDTFARTIYGEARGEGIIGMEAVAAVIMNRVNADLGNDDKPDWWGEGVEGVCRKPFQFSTWNLDDPNLSKIMMVRASEDSWFAHAIWVARQAMEGKLADPTGGASHYCRIDISPKWAIGKTPTAKIGRHSFYKL